MRTTFVGSLRAATVAAVIAGIALSACASEEPADPGDPPSGRDYVITYSAVATGDGVWNQIQYDNGEGSMLTATLGPGQQAWTSSQIQMKEGDNVFIAAQGAVASGTLSIAATGDDNGDNTIGTGDSKAGDGTTTIYDLATTPVTLP